MPIVPSRTWSLQQDEHLTNGNDAQPSLLGLSMRICEPESATENVWHVLDVIEGSPAESAGLVPMGDWILGKSVKAALHLYFVLTRAKAGQGVS